MSARIELQSAYILHTRPYRDTSLLVDALTQDYGKISLVAKGARSKHNKQRALLQPFSPLLLSWQGRSSLKTLVGIESQSAAILLIGHRLYSALYANELLAYLLPQGDPSDTIYQDYQQLLQFLNDSAKSIEPCLRWFEFNLLEMLGYGLDFGYEADTDLEIQPQQYYYWVQNHGFVNIERYPESRALRFPGEALLNIQQHQYQDKQTLRLAKQLSRLVLQPLLKGRPLKSRELFTSV